MNVSPIEIKAFYISLRGTYSQSFMDIEISLTEAFMSGYPTRSISAVLSREEHLYNICLAGRKKETPLLHFPKRKISITFL